MPAQGTGDSPGVLAGAAAPYVPPSQYWGNPPSTQTSSPAAPSAPKPPSSPAGAGLYSGTGLSGASGVATTPYGTAPSYTAPGFGGLTGLAGQSFGDTTGKSGTGPLSPAELAAQAAKLQ